MGMSDFGTGGPRHGDMPPEEFRRLAHETADWMADYLAGIDDIPVFDEPTPGALREALPQHAPTGGEAMDEVLRDFRELIVPGLTHWNHPAFYGYFAITSSGPGILGEMLTAALNVNAMVWRSSPAATELEDVSTDWLRRLLGLPAGFEGVINDTASSSTLHALAAAREVAFPGVRRTGLAGRSQGRVYGSAHAHSSVEKAVLTLGLGSDGYRGVEVDGAHAMDPGALRAAIEEDIAAGVQPVAIVPSLGTTTTAAIDPVRDIADLAEEFGVWLHVDAAYGGSAAVVPEVRERFAGWERADSIVVNPHKWLFTPIDCSVLYCRRPDVLVEAFSLIPEYLKTREQGAERSLMDYGVALGRRFRSLKLWFVLRYFGRDGIVDRIREHLRLASGLEALIRAEPGWTVVAPVDLGLVVFRFGDDDDVNRCIMERANTTGRMFLTHGSVDGRIVLRLAIGNIKTTEEHVAEAWQILRNAAAEVSRG